MIVSFASLSIFSLCPSLVSLCVLSLSLPVSERVSAASVETSGEWPHGIVLEHNHMFLIASWPAFSHAGQRAPPPQRKR